MSDDTSASRVRQAVILAGGLGERLRPLTDHTPKPMVPFHGRPFIDYLLDTLAENGFEEVVLLLGYLAEKIEAHVGDGSRYGLKVVCRTSPVEDDTGLRMWRARDAIAETFMLMYCDNYWPLRIDKMWEQFERTGVEGQLTVYDNCDGYTRSNLIVDEEGVIGVYDKTRPAQGLTGVDIGFAIFRHSVLDALDGSNVHFESLVYPDLVARRQLGGFVSRHRYYSVSTPQRLEATERFLARRPTVIVDRDGVLNAKAPRAEYVTTWDEFLWLPGAKESLVRLAEAGFRVVVVSNQAGIARDAMTEKDLDTLHTAMVADIEAAGGCIDAIYHCPHGWDDGCTCRKPEPGMLFEAQRDLDFDLTLTYFVGDDPRDAVAGAAAGCPTILVSPDEGLAAAVDRVLEGRDVDKQG